ncbi:unnamed protein product [Rotaria sp. Silwood1]|nr:unnamed protein product [Rotaria sp. Silwood1]
MSIVEAIIITSVWGPIVLFIIGVPAAIGNAIIFLGVKTFRQSPSSYYVVGQSIFDFGNLLIVLLASIPSTSMNASSIACKLMIYFSQIIGPCAMTFLFLATFDRWACTSRSVKIRQLSSIGIARRIFPIPFIFWSLVGIPYLIYCDFIPPFFTCGFTNVLFAQIAISFLAPIFSVIFPLIILIIFSILTYRNLHLMTIANAQQQSVRTRLSIWEQQITRMMIIQTVLIISCTMPRCILMIYTIATFNQGTMKSLNRIYIETLLDQLTACIMGLDFASSFYIFCLSSSRFRQTIKTSLKRFFKLGNNQVTSINISRPTAALTVINTHGRQN